MMKAAASTEGKSAGNGMHCSARTVVCVPNPPVPEKQATVCPTCRCWTPSPSAATTPAYSQPGTKGGSDPLKDGRNALSATDAQRDECVTAADTMQLGDGLDSDDRARGADRMPQRDTRAIWVDLGRIKL